MKIIRRIYHLITFVLIVNFVNAQNVQLAYDAFPGNCGSFPCSISPFDLQSLNNKIYFIGNDSPQALGSRVWVFDGQNAPQIVNGSPNEYILDIEVIDTMLLVFGKDNGIMGIWKLGLTGNLELIDTVVTSFNYPSFTLYHDKIYFHMGSTSNSKLWRYDPNDTNNPIVNLFPSDTISYPGGFVEYLDTLYFYCSLNKFCSFDGVNAPVHRTDILPSADYSVSPLSVYNNTLLLSAGNSGNGAELWSYNGNGQISLISDINAGPSSSFISSNTIFNGEFIFVADNGINGGELMKYDGINPPALISDINHTGSSNPRFLIEFGNRLIFRADNGLNGEELWSYDGVGPPVMLEDLMPGIESGYPDGFQIFNGKLFFGGADPIYGNELRSISPQAFQEELESSSYKLYPNPCDKGEFYLENPKGINLISIKLIDIAGREIPFEFQDLNDRIRVNLNTNEVGIIFIMLEFENKFTTYKLVLE